MIKQKNQRTTVKSILGILTGLLEACGDDKVIHIPVLKHTHERIGIAANWFQHTVPASIFRIGDKTLCA